MILYVRSEFRLQLSPVQSGLRWVQLSNAQFFDSVTVGHRDCRLKANINTLAQAEVRRNRLQNNTTRLLPSPDQAICKLWHKRTLAGYLTVLANRHSAASGLANTSRLSISNRLPMAAAECRTSSQLLLALSLLVGSNLHLVAAQTHAAPASRTFLADIQKMDGASLAFADAASGLAGQQHHSVFGKRAD